jgi:hypothetical protein
MSATHPAPPDQARDVLAERVRNTAIAALDSLAYAAPLARSAATLSRMLGDLLHVYRLV